MRCSIVKGSKPVVKHHFMFTVKVSILQSITVRKVLEVVASLFDKCILQSTLCATTLWGHYTVIRKQWIAFCWKLWQKKLNADVINHKLRAVPPPCIPIPLIPILHLLHRLAVKNSWLTLLSSLFGSTWSGSRRWPAKHFVSRITVNSK